jgi:hypothetical protein
LKTRGAGGIVVARWQPEVPMRNSKHRVEETAEAVGDKASEVATKVVHAAQERAQKVSHGVGRLATKIKNRREELKRRHTARKRPQA